MRQIAWVALVALCATPVHAQTLPNPVMPAAPAVQDTMLKNAYQFVLDYDVPESPAFAALGATPTNVLRGGAAKPVVLSVLSNALTTGRLSAGLAVDVSPMVLVSPTFRSFNDYQKRAGLLRRFLLSLAKIQSPIDTASIEIGAGLRINLFDANDPLTDPALFNQVNAMLRQAVGPPPAANVEDQIGAPVALLNPDSIAAVYDSIRQQAARRPGMAMSLGWGWAGMLHNSVLSGDSLKKQNAMLWLAGRYHFASPASLLFTAQWHSNADSASTFEAGAALRADLPNASVAAELVYDWRSHDFEPGANIEVRVIPGIVAVFAVVTQTDAATPGAPPKVRAETNLKWNFAELLQK